jgi:hypothetical protein
VNIQVLARITLRDVNAEDEESFRGSTVIGATKFIRPEKLAKRHTSRRIRISGDVVETAPCFARCSMMGDRKASFS